MKDAAAKSGEAGFTLVEMLVAVMLFGIIATIATTLTTSATRSFAVTDTTLASISGLEQVRAILAADLGQATKRPSLTQDGKQLNAFTLLPEGFVLVRGGLAGSLPNVQKVAWGFDGQNLLRQTFPTIDGSAPTEAIVLVPNVRAISLRVATPTGWQSQWQPTRPEDLPRALEMTLIRQDGRPIVMKFLVGS